jgi:hypothetical protein
LKRLNYDLNAFGLILAGKGLCLWMKEAVESELVFFRSEIEIIQTTHYLYEEFKEEFLKRRSLSESLNSFFANENFEFFQNSFLVGVNQDISEIIDPFNGSLLFQRGPIESAKGQVGLLNFKNNSFERSFVIKMGSNIMDESCMRFCSYLKRTYLKRLALIFGHFKTLLLWNSLMEIY